MQNSTNAKQSLRKTAPVKATRFDSEDIDVGVHLLKQIQDNQQKVISDTERKKKENAEKQRRIAADNREKARRAALERKRQEVLKKNEEIRKAAKDKSKNIAFGMCLSSCVFSTCVIGLLVWLMFAESKSALAFILLVSAIGMANTLLHTFLYTKIKEEIYKK